MLHIDGLGSFRTFAKHMQFGEIRNGNLLWDRGGTRSVGWMVFLLLFQGYNQYDLTIEYPWDAVITYMDKP
jgi:hypothetical protein